MFCCLISEPKLKVDLNFKKAMYFRTLVYTVHLCSFDFRYAYLLLIMNYIFPLVTLSVTYTRVGIEQWGSRAIGEDISMQHDRVKTKRKVKKISALLIPL